MNTKILDRLPTITAVVLTVLVIAACTIRLRGEDNQAPSATSMDRASDPLAAKLEQCRSVTSEQPEVLADAERSGPRSTANSSERHPQRHQNVPLLPVARHCSSLRMETASQGSAHRVTV